MLICPLCQSVLTKKTTAYHCRNGHHFDCGKFGDINLLLANQKKSSSPGDSKKMVSSRRDFLATGYFQPIAEMLAKYITLLSQGEPKVIADAGCGDGYYLRKIQRLCYPNTDYFNAYGGRFIGWDISKYAVQAAAKQSDPNMTWITASSARLPIADDAIDILICGFGFVCSESFYRVLKKSSLEKNSGYLVVIDPNAEHLLSLREIIYDNIKPHKKRAIPRQFKCIKQDTLKYELTLNTEQLQQIMHMTPHLYRAGYHGKESLKNLGSLSTCIDINLSVYQTEE